MINLKTKIWDNTSDFEEFSTFCNINREQLQKSLAECGSDPRLPQPNFFYSQNGLVSDLFFVFALISWQNSTQRIIELAEVPSGTEDNFRDLGFQVFSVDQRLEDASRGMLELVRVLLISLRIFFIRISSCLKLIKHPPLSDAEVIVDRFFTTGKFLPDRFYPGIKIDKGLIFVANIKFFGLLSLWKLIRETKENPIIFKELYLPFLLPFRTYFRYLKTRFLFKTIRDPVGEILFRYSFNLRLFDHYLEAEMTNYSFERIGPLPNLKFAVCWWEGQVGDYAWIGSCRLLNKKIFVKAYLGFFPRSSDYHLIWGKAHPPEIRPNEIIVVGPYAADFFRKNRNRDSEISVSLGPPFRFLQLLSEVDSIVSDVTRSSKPLPIAKKERRLSIGLALGVNRNESIQLLGQLSQIIDPQIHSLAIFMHPTQLKDKALITGLDLLGEFSHGDKALLIDRAIDLAIVGGSSIAIEFVICGIPTVNFAAQCGLQSTVFSSSSNYWRVSNDLPGDWRSILEWHIGICDLAYPYSQIKDQFFCSRRELEIGC